MKLLAGSLGLFLAVTALGCSGQSRARTPDELFASMALDLSRSMDHGVGEAVGTTTLTSASVPAAEAAPMPPMALPDDRMPLSVLGGAASSTWGATSPETSDGIPATREAD